MPKHFDKAERVGLLGQNDPVFCYFRRSLRGIVLTTPLIYLNPYSGNRRLIALRTFSAVNCPVNFEIAQIAQKFLTGHFTNEEPNSLVNPRRRPWTKKLTQRCLQNQPELPMKSADDRDPNRLTIRIPTIWRPVSANHCRKWAISKCLGNLLQKKSATQLIYDYPSICSTSEGFLISLLRALWSAFLGAALKNAMTNIPLVNMRGGVSNVVISWVLAVLLMTLSFLFSLVNLRETNLSPRSIISL